MSEVLSEEFPFTYKVAGGIEYEASYRPETEKTLMSRVSIVRVDGNPIIVEGAEYPAGYVLGHGDEFAEFILKSLKFRSTE